MKIAIIGAGYVGLVSGVCLASIGHDVICVDNNSKKITSLKKGQVPIYEPGLKELMEGLVKKKKLSFSISIKEATKESAVIFIAVGTPSKKNGDADLTYVENVAREIARSMNSYRLIIEKSTVPTSTGQRVAKTIKANLPKGKKVEFDVASNPEFLREGSAIADFMNPDRIVIGVESKKAEELLKEVYNPLKAKIVVTNINSAEMIKHASNSFLAMKISFANALSQICDRAGADVIKVAEGMGYDKRIGRAFLNAGIGYGGSCFPKDVDAFIRLSKKYGYDFRLLEEVRQVNEDQKASFVQLIEDKLWIVKDKKIGVLGLAFKPETDDIRNAPALDILKKLLAEGARVHACDPEAVESTKRVLKGIKYETDVYKLAKNCDCLLLLTEWPQFKDLDFKKIHKNMHQPIIFDGRNFWDKKKLKKIGFEYYGIGRGED